MTPDSFIDFLQRHNLVPVVAGLLYLHFCIRPVLVSWRDVFVSHNALDLALARKTGVTPEEISRARADIESSVPQVPDPIKALPGLASILPATGAPPVDRKSGRAHTGLALAIFACSFALGTASWIGCVTVETAGRDTRGAQDVGTVASNQTAGAATVPVSLVPGGTP